MIVCCFECELNFKPCLLGSHIPDMGNSDSKLVFKEGIFKLSQPRAIPADDVYWTGVRISGLILGVNR